MHFEAHTLAAEWRMDYRRRGSGRHSAASRGDGGGGDQAEMDTFERELNAENGTGNTWCTGIISELFTSLIKT